MQFHIDLQPHLYVRFDMCHYMYESQKTQI